MPNSPNDSLSRALAGVLRERLMQRDDIEVPGLGTFCVRHQPSRLHDEGGQQSLLPPRDVVHYKPAAPSR